MRTSEQKHYLDLAKKAALNKDAMSVIGNLHKALIPDGLINYLRKKWDTIDLDDIKDITSDAFENLFSEIKKGKIITYLVTYLYRIANNLAYDFYKKQEKNDSTTIRLDDSWDEKISKDDLIESSSNYIDDEELMKKAISQAKILAGQLNPVNVRLVMEYIIDGIEKGIDYLPNNQIAETLGLNPSTVRVCRMRGFQRLSDLAREQGITLNKLNFEEENIEEEYEEE